MYLITGATGNIGRHLVDQLVRADVPVRALSRDPATADLPAAVEVARTAELPMRNVTAVFVNVAAFWDDSAALLARAAEHGVRRIVLLSTSAVLLGTGPDNPIGTHHLGVEQAVAETGMEWVFLRPDEFAANALVWADEIARTGAVRSAYGGAHRTPIHERDIAAVAARALLTDDLVGTKPELTGPESLTRADRVRIIGEVLGVPARWDEISAEEARPDVAAQFGPDIADSLLRTWAATVDRPLAVSPEVQRILGRPALTFAQWVGDHRADFRAPAA